jgi:hypothetical protein
MSRIGSLPTAASQPTEFQDMGARETREPDTRSHNTILPDDGQATMPLLNQGRSNGCGTTSLAMILTFLGVERTQTEIDAEMRRQDIFAAPNDLAQYARGVGLNAKMYNHGTAQELVHFVDQGVPTQILTTADGSGDPAKMHYVVITGYERQQDGSVSFEVQNPWGVHQTWSAEELDARWGNTPFGFDHFYMAVAASEADLPSGRTKGVEGTLNAADGIGSVVAGYDRVVHARNAGEFLRGVGDAGSGVPQALIGGALGGLQLGADYLQVKVEGLPVVGAPLAFGIEHLESRLGTLNIAVGAFSNSVSHLYASVEHLANGEVLEGASDLARSPVELARGAWDVAVDVVQDTVKGVEALGGATATVVVGAAKEVAHAVSRVVDSFGSWTGWW